MACAVGVCDTMLKGHKMNEPMTDEQIKQLADKIIKDIITVQEAELIIEAYHRQ